MTDFDKNLEKCGPRVYGEHVPSWVRDAKRQILMAAELEMEDKRRARHINALRFSSGVIIDYAPEGTPINPVWGEFVFDIGNQLESFWEFYPYTPAHLLAVCNPRPDRAEIAVLTDHICVFRRRISESEPVLSMLSSIRSQLLENPDAKNVAY
ncbi:hypothetical protein GZ206_05690 [Dermatophilus congolensis]|uniref:hypothetical protein n=1 Tax=Dermatophilus congolensis TaxID=1863 RepID=UPI001AB04A17|nr:hypothetical protein [Dermatophilus congolensis]MBO3167742.1 hypothetical protein [Dermatophilus congolensis]